MAFLVIGALAVIILVIVTVVGCKFSIGFPSSLVSVKTIKRFSKKVKNYFKQGSRMKSSDKTSEEKSSLVRHEDLVIVVEDLSTADSESSQDQTECEVEDGED
jgi:hypothetical protein